MAFNFSANQYESPYKPKALCNWEIPKNYFHYKPQQRKGSTRFIANDRGHLLLDVKTNRLPWGNYLGTCHMPTKFDRKPPNQNDDIGENEAKIIKGIYEMKRKELVEDEIRANILPVEKLPENDQQSKLVYTPGDLIEEKYRYQPYQDQQPLDPIMKQENEDSASKSPILDAISNFEIAKQLHRENLQHVPLPDMLTDTVLKRLQLENADLQANEAPTAIGWKGYPGHGPTRCTKLKIYRPKSSDKNNNRSSKSSVLSFDKKWRFLRRRKVTPIELAVCWDLYPENANDEPKPPKHIDGSNGSQAPAVFSLIKSQKSNQTNYGNCERIFERLPNQLKTDRDFVLERPKTAAPLQRPQFEKYEEKNKFFERFKFNKRSKSACNLNNKSSKSVNNFNKSTPNLNNYCHCCSHCYCSNPSKFYQEKCRNKRLCMACEMKNININNNNCCSNKNEYKISFKAGIPQKRNNVSNRNNYQIRFNYKVPKQRNPFSPRQYRIHSLVPPFSLQKDKSHEYPEFWRLTTVYQQSYKPIQYRKGPLIETVFK